MSVRYLLNPWMALRGWKKLPYGIQNLISGRAEFFDRDLFELFLSCDGKSPFDPEWSREEELEILAQWEKNNIIHKCESGETLRPYQQYKYYDSVFREAVHWSITGHCNFKCRHCFMSAPHARTKDPTLEELTEMLDAFSECGIAAVDLTGGEPLIRPDFFELLDRIREKNITVRTIFSNGHLVTDAFLQKLKERRIHPNFQMSFDGIGWHDWMRGVPGAEQAVLDAFRRCQREGFSTTASMVVFRENIGTIRDTVKLLAEAGCSQLKISIASPAGEWKNETEHYLTREEAFHAYLDYIPKYFEDGSPLTLIMEGMFVFDPKSGRAFSMFEKNCPEEYFGTVFSCAQMRRHLYVSPQGNVLPCMSMIGTEAEPLFPNMKKTPLKEILEKSYFQKVSGMTIQEYMQANPECSRCEFRERCCGGCRAAGTSSGTGSCYSKDPSACAYFKNGWYKRKEALFKELGIDDDGNYLTDEGCV